MKEQIDWAFKLVVMAGVCLFSIELNSISNAINKIKNEPPKIEHVNRPDKPHEVFIKDDNRMFNPAVIRPEKKIARPKMKNRKMKNNRPKVKKENHNNEIPNRPMMNRRPFPNMRNRGFNGNEQHFNRRPMNGMGFRNRMNQNRPRHDENKNYSTETK